MIPAFFLSNFTVSQPSSRYSLSQILRCAEIGDFLE